MKKIFLFMLSGAFPVLLSAQVSLERQVVSSGGGYATAGTITLSYTIGEAVTTTATGTTLILTQGFQQEQFYGVGLEVTENGLTINAYPNPTNGAVILDMNADENIDVTIEVMDVLGRINDVPVSNLNFTGISRQEIDLSPYAAGNYFLIVRSTDGSWQQSIQVQKIN